MSEIVTIILLFGPLLVIMWLANVAEQARLRSQPTGLSVAAAYGLLIFFYALLIGIGLLVQAAGVALAGSEPDFGLLDLYINAGIDPTFAANLVNSLPAIGFGLWFPVLLGLLLLLPSVRRWFGRFIPIDPASHVHAIALAFTALVVVNLLVTLGVGLGNLAAAATAAAEAGVQSNLILSLWTQQLLTALLAVVGIGWLRRRRGKELLERLKLTWPNGRQWLIGVGIGLALVPVALGLEQLGSALGWQNSDVDQLAEALLGPLFTSIPGILTLGLAAAVGEETLFRGAVQPRFGLLFTSLLFALLHSTYGISLATLVVFCLGLILGWVRNRYSTTLAMVVHAIYNMTLGIIAFFAGGFIHL